MIDYLSSFGAQNDWLMDMYFISFDCWCFVTFQTKHLTVELNLMTDTKHKIYQNDQLKDKN